MVAEAWNHDEIEQELHQALAEILGRRGVMATKWMVVAEGLADNGSRDLLSFSSPDFRSWDSIGFIGFLDARERGAVGAAAAAEHGESEE